MGRSAPDKKGGAIRKKSRANRMVQWWRKLALPRRGKKDSLLSPSSLTVPQLDRLAERTAMWLKSILAPRATRIKHLATAHWQQEVGRAVVTVPRGSILQSMGTFENSQHLLWPEEALFLVDKGSMELCIGELPMSVQRAWAETLCADNALRLEAYLAFAHLRRAGYVARRYIGKQAPGLQLDLSAWRVGGFRRHGEVKPTFNVATYGYDESVPRVADVQAYLETCDKSRLRIALIDRGIVVLVDVAANATPLSNRFVRKLPGMQREAAEKMQEGQVGQLFDEDLLKQFDDASLL